jgi:transposase
MALHLSETEIRKRLTKLRNYERLYPELRRKHKQRGEEIQELRTTVAEQQAIIEKLLLRVEELERMVFGSRGSSADDDQNTPMSRNDEPPARMQRTAKSYRRSTPTQEQITERSIFSIHACPDCGTTLRRKETVMRFVEDIPLPRKTVEQQTIERGWCPHCRKTKSAVPISPQVCTLGPNVRMYIPFAVTVLGQTFEKMKAHLHGVHGLAISDGEITQILHEAHRKLLPAKQTIDAAIRASPVSHYDETTYPVQRGEKGNYAWVKTRADGPETVFLLGRTRGKGNAEEIRGPPSEQVGVTDDYGAYDNLFEHHALCWAHPLRKIRDLAQSSVLPVRQRKACERTYTEFKTLFQNIDLFIAEEHSVQERDEAHRMFTQHIVKVMTPRKSDPPKLRTIKKTFQENTEQYLLCVRIPNVPMTNNKAERSLRCLVIKRLLSFGSRTQKGAQTMETLLSVLLTLWWKKPKDYFEELRALMAA